MVAKCGKKCVLVKWGGEGRGKSQNAKCRFKHEMQMKCSHKKQQQQLNREQLKRFKH